MRDNKAVPIIQYIRIEWGKLHRGADSATLREQIPSSLPLPNEIFSYNRDYGIPVQNLVYSAQNDFKQPLHNSIHLLKPSSIIKFGCCKIEMGEVGVSVFFEYDQHECGLPIRKMFINPTGYALLNEKAFDLKADEFGRIVYNGRHQGWDDAWYEKKIINIGYTDKKDKDLFKTLNLKGEYVQLAKLF